jgi:hypothetical protein
MKRFDYILLPDGGNPILGLFRKKQQEDTPPEEYWKWIFASLNLTI